jgi:hypothetical protein
MAANLLRVMRGHGRPSELPQQIINLSELILEANELSDAWGIWSVIEETLQSAFPESESFDYGDRPELTVASGSLQFLASSLLFQRAQEAAGRREINEGVNDFERRRERLRERMREENLKIMATLRRKSRKKAKRPSPKATPKPAKISAGKAQPAAEPEPTGTVDFLRRRQRELRGEDS